MTGLIALLGRLEPVRPLLTIVLLLLVVRVRVPSGGRRRLVASGSSTRGRELRELRGKRHASGRAARSRREPWHVGNRWRYKATRRGKSARREWRRRTVPAPVVVVPSTRVVIAASTSSVATSIIVPAAIVVVPLSSSASAVPAAATSAPASTTAASSAADHGFILFVEGGRREDDAIEELGLVCVL
ncbi:hypothetical protein M011DRAFT_164477 [Sporormia fimetaria CBS 119925]|uniref:Uncharacterized protein n=1 Tax=Sporormia fimetaria CBS 119925 TaxID=1340428 RepID=A0A6A6V656_9PLEO|nr:hypothetical protein M011DRAFT_164477 [Sporormia fimetaria CBS 119925]